MDFAPPTDWFSEDADDVTSTKTVYDVLARLLTEGHKVDLVDVWENIPPEAITALNVSLGEVDRDSFQFFENHKFDLIDKSLKLGTTSNPPPQLA